MKIDLSRDPLFQKKDSPTKDIKQKQRQRQKLIRMLRTTQSQHQKPQLTIQIIDPLPEQLQKYKHEIEYKKMFESSKASQKLKKYIIQQERNLKCVRLEKIQLEDREDGEAGSRLRKSAIRFNMSSRNNSKEREDKQNKQINIPKIEQLFKNQQKQYVLYQSRMMRTQLTKAINSIDTTMNKFKSYSTSTSSTTSVAQIKKNTTTQRFPGIGAGTGTGAGLGPNQSAVSQVNLNEEDFQIDKIIQKKMAMSKKLRDKLYREKKEMMTHQAKESSDSQNMGFFLNIPKKPKRKVLLQGVKSITFCEGSRKIQVTPASSLLFSLNKMSNGRDKKQIQLQGLIQNSYQNRQSILSQKSTFYDQQTPFKDLSPSNQFKLRQLMDKKLLHRLQLSKQQINKFTAYLNQIKQYHVILNETILQILKEVREFLMTGKVMKLVDFRNIMEGKEKEKLGGFPNQVILERIVDMMV